MVHTVREKKGWTKARMAQETGLDESLLSRYERGEVVPSEASWDRILRAGDIDPSFRDSLLAAARDFLERVFAGIARPAHAACGNLPGDLQELLSSATRFLARPAPLETTPADPAEQVQRLLACEPSERSEVIRIAPEFHSLSLALLACKESLREAAREPHVTIELADIAVAVAKMLEFPWENRFRAWALAHLFNALRVAGELDRADGFFADAKTLWESGPPDPGILDPGLIFGLGASLRRAQRRFDEALDLHDQAIALSWAPGIFMIQKATTLEQMGDYESALATLDEADRWLIEREPRDEFLLAINRGANLCHLQRHREAAGFAQTAMRVADELENDLDRLRARWLQGRVLLGLGDREAARALLEEVRGQFLARSLPYDAALASLELSELYLQDGRFAEVREMTAELVALFESKNIHREALAALQLFHQSVVLEAATAELAHSVVTYLYRARYDPELRFSTAA